MEEQIVNAIIHGKLIAFASLFLAVLIRLDLPRLLGEVRAWRSESIEKLTAILDSEISPELHQVLHEKYEQLCFHQYFKIYVNREMRHWLIKLHETNPSIATWDDLRRAYRYLKPTAGHMEIDIKWHHHVGRWFVTGLSSIILVYAIALTVLGLMMQLDGQTNSLFAMSIIGLAFFALSLLISSFNWPFESAKKLQPLLIADGQEK